MYATLYTKTLKARCPAKWRRYVIRSQLSPASTAHGQTLGAVFFCVFFCIPKISAVVVLLHAHKRSAPVRFDSRAAWSIHVEKRTRDRSAQRACNENNAGKTKIYEKKKKRIVNTLRDSRPFVSRCIPRQRTTQIKTKAFKRRLTDSWRALAGPAWFDGW